VAAGKTLSLIALAKRESGWQDGGVSVRRFLIAADSSFGSF
jgi:hypothetical protein